MNVLITSASRKVSLVEAFKKALAEEGEGHVIAVDVSPTAPALYRADRHFLVPRTDDPSFLRELSSLCEREAVGLVVPTRDEELPVFAHARSRFEAHGVRVMVADPETIDICQDKLRFADFCAKAGLGTPDLRDRENPGPFPVFVKPRHGKGGRGASVARNPEELAGVLSALGGDAVIQEYLQSVEYTVDLFADFSGNVVSVVPRERILVVGGESYVSRTVRNPQIRDEAMRLAKALHLVGHNTIQCFLHAGRVKFIEVNARFGGAAALGFAAGAPTPRFLVRLLAGKEVPPQIDGFRDNLYMLRYTEDLFMDAGDLAR